MKFTELPLDESLTEALGYIGFEDATPVQEQSIPAVLEGKDILACAQTGTGKTGAFLIPIMHKLITSPSNYIDTLVICPTRELAVQIDQQIQGIGYTLDISSIAVYGGGDGDDWETQKNAMKSGTNIIVATPGKLISHLKMNNADFSHLRHLVLDEADRMLDMGFYHDIQTIISYLPKERQTLLFSATMPQAIRQLAKRNQQNPIEISLNISKPAEGVKQGAYLVFRENKVDLLAQLLRERENYSSIIIFTSTKEKVNEIARGLRSNKLPCKTMSSNLEQTEREEVIGAFRSKRVRILVATDVVSRGIDIKDINLVVNYDVPADAEEYVHRVGRTARANTKGEAITLISPEDMGKFAKIEELIGSSIEKTNTPEAIGPSPKWEVRSRNKFNNRKKKPFHKKKKHFKPKSKKE